MTMTTEIVCRIQITYRTITYFPHKNVLLIVQVRVKGDMAWYGISSLQILHTNH